MQSAPRDTATRQRERGQQGALLETGTYLEANYLSFHDELPDIVQGPVMPAGRDDMWHGAEQVAGDPMIRISGRKARLPEQPVSLHAGAEAGPAPRKGRLRAFLGRR